MARRDFPGRIWPIWSTRRPSTRPGRNKNQIEMHDFEFAKDKVLMGGERRSMVISDEEKADMAYHEAGHAIVAMLMPGTDPIHKVTIIPRGGARDDAAVAA